MQSRQKPQTGEVMSKKVNNAVVLVIALSVADICSMQTV